MLIVEFNGARIILEPVSGWFRAKNC